MYSAKLYEMQPAKNKKPDLVVYNFAGCSQGDSKSLTFFEETHMKTVEASGSQQNKQIIL
jgi:hypothetical protein